MGRKIAAQDHSENYANGDETIEDAKDFGALLLRVGSRHQRGGAGREACRPGADAEAGNNQGSQAASQPRNQGESAPNEGHHSDGFAAAPSVDQMSGRQGAQDDANKIDGTDQTGLPITEAKRELHWLQDD
jgi:hypothetical protein